MSNVNQLSAGILDVLKEASSPLMAKEIASSLQEKYGLKVTKTDVNSLLYGTLTAKVNKDGENRWSLSGSKENTLPLRQPATGGTLQSTAEDGQTGTDGISTTTTLPCPKCGKAMVSRTAKRGPNAGKQFYGCADYPHCKGTLDAEKGSSEIEVIPTGTPESPGEHRQTGAATPSGSQSEPAPPEASGGLSCPDCGARMQIRTARRGGNAGGQFYGCSRYPQCRATIAIDDNDHEEPTQRHQQTREATDYPRRIAAFSSTFATFATFLECVALPNDAISAAIIDDIPKPHLRALCQWQLDLPQVTESHSLSQTTWLPVVEKILKRGRAISLSPWLESELQSIEPYLQIEAGQWAETLKSAAVTGRPAPVWHDGFDSDEEKLFLCRVLPAIAGKSITGWIQRQVSFDGLVDGDDHEPTDRRVDFLISHPWGLQLIVEIDGAQHGEQVESDKRRDADLQAAGCEVIRIPAHEIRDGVGESLSTLKNRLSGIRFDKPASSEFRFLSLVRWAHQLQVALWYSAAMGIVATNEGQSVKVSVCLDDSFHGEAVERFTSAVLDDLNNLITDVASLYEETNKRILFEYSADPDITIRFTTDYTGPTSNTIFIRDVYLPLTISTEISAFAPANATNVTEPTCERLLKRIFGFDAFREGQFEAIARCLTGEDAIVLLPTGAGKSVAFQLAAFLRPGVCIVIDPIISLIDDQIENLRGYGIDRIAQITSAIESEGRRAILNLLARGEYQFCYVAPERFQDQKFRESLRILTTHTAISLVTIDEAHCVSEWGHDFRPAYLNIARISRDYCATDGIAPPLMALTGTASRAVLKDVQRELQIGDFEAIITPSTFDRAELHFRTVPCRSNEKILRLRGLLESLPRHFNQTPTSFFECRGKQTHSGLVFCPFVGGDFGVVRVSEEVARSLNRRVPFYSGGAPKGITEKDWRKKKTLIARNFKRNEVPLMACTKAFGMGIDKPNIRYTVHYGIPCQH